MVTAGPLFQVGATSCQVATSAECSGDSQQNTAGISAHVRHTYHRRGWHCNSGCYLDSLTNGTSTSLLREAPFLWVLQEKHMTLTRSDKHAEKTAASSKPTHPFTRSCEARGRQFLTYQDIMRTLLLCGVKQNCCMRALERLWQNLLAICYDTPSNRVVYSNWVAGKCAAIVDGAPVEGDFATVVRHSGPVVAGRKSGGAEPVSVNTLIGSIATSGSGDGAPNFIIIVAKHIFDRLITQQLAQELTGERITAFPLSRWYTAQEITQHRRPLIIFCGGTSGCGKSTLSSLIIKHICTGTLLSTDTIRQVLRNTLRVAEYPELFVSTYQAHLVATGKSRGGNVQGDAHTEGKGMPDVSSVIAGYERQSEAVLKLLDAMLERLICRNQPVVVEGVHLLPSYIHRKKAELQSRGVRCFAFILCIAREECHLRRFCTRAKGMSLLPDHNKYVLHFRSIRHIQDHLLYQARSLGIASIENGNVDKSLAVVHNHLLNNIDRVRSSKPCHGAVEARTNHAFCVGTLEARGPGATWMEKAHTSP
uniref:Zeta toxin domain-containing protein n=1 Tax=Trypanosoma vivax (strain Y486) TaxID=1055687 RepID=G0U8F3_TRYVY|nr:conserved hypothetical protein [Trypanosoma vivax Y486]